MEKQIEFYNAMNQAMSPTGNSQEKPAEPQLTEETAAFNRALEETLASYAVVPSVKDTLKKFSRSNWARPDTTDLFGKELGEMVLELLACPNSSKPVSYFEECYGRRLASRLQELLDKGWLNLTTDPDSGNQFVSLSYNAGLVLYPHC